MGAIIDWLTRDEQEELFGIIFAFVLNLLFLALIWLLLWLLDRAAMAVDLGKGYSLFWLLLVLANVLLSWLQQIFRVDIDSNYTAFVRSNLAVSGTLQAGWSAFAALALHGALPGAPLWMSAILFLVALLSCYITFQIVSAYFTGQIYRFLNLPIAALSFLLFSAWPTGARWVAGWVYHLL